jgi:glucose/arabinose dehydrogenase
MGDDFPPGKMNRIDKMGEEFGFPAAGTPAPTNSRMTRRGAWTIVPEVEQSAHAADLGLSFYTGDMFPSPARFLESDGAGRRSSDGYLPQG